MSKQYNKLVEIDNREEKGAQKGRTEKRTLTKIKMFSQWKLVASKKKTRIKTIKPEANFNIQNPTINISWRENWKKNAKNRNSKTHQKPFKIIWHKSNQKL